MILQKGSHLQGMVYEAIIPRNRWNDNLYHALWISLYLIITHHFMLMQVRRNTWLWINNRQLFMRSALIMRYDAGRAGSVIVVRGSSHCCYPGLYVHCTGNSTEWNVQSHTDDWSGFRVISLHHSLFSSQKAFDSDGSLAWSKDAFLQMKWNSWHEDFSVRFQRTYGVMIKKPVIWRVSQRFALSATLIRFVVVSAVGGQAVRLNVKWKLMTDSETDVVTVGRWTSVTQFTYRPVS